MPAHHADPTTPSEEEAVKEKGLEVAMTFLSAAADFLAGRAKIVVQRPSSEVTEVSFKRD